MLIFSRDTNVLANLALINPDISCKGKIEVIFEVQTSPEEFDFLTPLVGTLIGFRRLYEVHLGRMNGAQWPKVRCYLFTYNLSLKDLKPIPAPESS